MNGVRRGVGSPDSLMCTDAPGEAVNSPRALCTVHNSHASLHTDVHTPLVSQLLRFFPFLKSLCERIAMFRAPVLSTQCVFGACATLKEVCNWVGVDDSTGTQFAGQLGDESLQNISLLASLQPMDVKQACKAVSATPIGRWKLRMVYAVARLKFDMDPIDFGTPAPEVPIFEA